MGNDGSDGLHLVGDTRSPAAGEVFVEHMDKVGTHLGAAVDAYNRMIGSYDERIMPQARRFEEMGVTSDGTLRQPELIDSRPRESRNLLFNGGERA